MNVALTFMTKKLFEKERAILLMQRAWQRFQQRNTTEHNPFYAAVAQYVAWYTGHEKADQYDQWRGAESLYRYVVVAPPSYEQAQTRTC